MGQVSVVKIFPELPMLLEVDKNGLAATFAVAQKLDSGHVHWPFLFLRDSIAPRLLMLL